MQDRYAGDIGDFGKYGLLRALCGEDLRLGVLWYRVPDESGSNDGRFIEYLDPPDERLRECDPDLFKRMHAVAYGGDRSIAAVEKSGALPEGTSFHGKVLAFDSRERPKQRTAKRREWLDSALQAVKHADLVFADPDTGLEIPSTRPLLAKGPKYAYYGDLVPCWERGQSLVIYQHATRGAGGVGWQITRRIEELREHFGSSLDPIVLRWRRISARTYFILPAPQHVERLTARVLDFLDTEWGERGHFTLFEAVQ